MVSPAKYFHKHAFSDIFPAFCAHFTALVAPLVSFSNNNDSKRNLLAKLCMKRCKTSINITLGVFFSLYS